MEFIEIQKLKLWWLYIILGIETIIVLSIILFDKNSNGLNNSTERYYLPVLAIAIPYIVVYIVTQNKLTVKIDRHGVAYSYWPFVREKQISWAEITKLQLCKYDALGDYGGWGLRYRLWFKFNDKAYLFNDKSLGFQLMLKNQKKILFSTNKVDELTLFLINLKQQNNIGAIETDVREG